MEKQELTPEQVYKRNQNRSKWLGRLAPIVFWVFLAISVICLVFALRNSIGNVAEICDLLDSDVYTGEQLQENYNYLTEKYGTWQIGDGGSYFNMTFVNLKKALFSGVMVTDLVLCFVFLTGAFVLGKWLMPRLAEQMKENNQDYVNLTILKNSEK